MTLPSLVPGALFDARWIVGRVLGKNELAVVYEAEESREARFAALKLFDTALARDSGAWQRFETLTRSLAAVATDGIAKSYQVGLSGGRPFVASERCVFPTLSRTIADRKALDLHLQQVAQQGYALDDEERYLGVRCVAAPVFDHRNKVIAALSLSGPAIRVTWDRLPALIALVKRKALDISEALGRPHSLPAAAAQPSPQAASSVS